MRNFKRIIAASLLALTVFTIPVKADTSTFTLTVTKNGQYGDALSKRTLKAGGASFEKKFYVTNETFNGKGTMNVTSINLNNSKIQSYPKSLNSATKGIKDKKGTEYKSYAPANQYYYLKAVYGSGAIEDSLNATGRYTP